MTLSRLLPLVLAMVLAAGAPAFAKEAMKQSTATYNSFDALTATVWRADGRRGVLTVQGGLDVQDGALRARAAASGPVLRDAYVRALNVYAQSLVPGALPDVDQIGMRLQRATDGVLRRAGARVLLGTVLVN
jgi:flagellar basal body-associated protein FliL